MKIVTRALCGVGGILVLVLQLAGQGRESSPQPVARVSSVQAQQDADRPTRPASSQAILSATRDFQKAVNGKASVRNHCRVQGKNFEIEETAEVVESDKCKLIIKVVKATHPGKDYKASADTQPFVEFMIHADLSNLTIPVLVETQKFAQCEASTAEVLKVSSRSDPKKPLQVVRRAQPGAAAEGLSQIRHDLSLFFPDPVAARKAARALDRAVKACGGKEWPDEDDLP